MTDHVGSAANLECVNWSAENSASLAQELVGASGARWDHTCGVSRTAASWRHAGWISENVVSAAWLHDIGYAPGLVRSGMHAVDGAAYLDLHGAPKLVVSLVAFHTGAEYEADERGLIDKLIQFDRPPQDDLDILILADLVTSPDGSKVCVRDRLDDIFDRYEAQHPVHRAVTRSREYLEESAARAASRVGHPM